METSEREQALANPPTTNTVKYPYLDDQFNQDWRDGLQATRVIDLLPGENKDRLQCTVRFIRLDNPPSYEALSYAWLEDSDENSKQATQDATLEELNVIYVNEAYHLEISAALKAALLAIRQPDQPRTLWIDQLCIDQTNLAEKAFQVQQMGLIYSTAGSVILWTGLEDSATPSVVHTVEQLARLWTEFGAASPEACEVHSEFTKGMAAANFAHIPSLVSFFHRHVFFRGWIVQEIALAKAVVVKCGSNELDWQKVASAVKSMASLSRAWRSDCFSRATEAGEKSSPVKYIVDLYDEIRKGGSSVTLFKALSTMHHFQTTDPRDKVFAALGLCRFKDSRHILKVDYTLSVSEVFSRATMALISDEKAMTPFSFAGLTNRRIDSLPTWAIDWSTSPIGSNNISMTQDFDAAKGLRSMICWPIGLQSELRVPMVVLSAKVDKIAHTRKRIDQGPVGSRTKTIESWIELAFTDRSQYANGEDVLMAFLRTLAGPCPRDWKGPDSTYEYDYELDLTSVALDNVFSTDNDECFFDFTHAGQKGVDIEIPYYRENGHLTAAERLADGTFVCTVEQSGTLRWLHQSDIRALAKDLKEMLDKFLFFVTELGYFGLGVAGLMEGDEIHVVGGSATPLAFREVVAPDRTTCSEQRLLVSECHVQGLMYGEAMDLATTTVGLIAIV